MDEDGECFLERVAVTELFHHLVEHLRSSARSESEKLQTKEWGPKVAEAPAMRCRVGAEYAARARCTRSRP